MDEYEIMQNRALGAHILHTFLKEYTGEKYGRKIHISMIMPIIPIALNRHSRNAIYRRRLSKGSLMTVLSEDNSAFLGTQDRMEEMADLTLKSLGLAFSFGNIRIEKNTGMLSLGDENITGDYRSENYTEILGASRRLGLWFSELTEKEIINYFNLTI